MLRHLTLALVLVATTTAKADEGTLLLEHLVKIDQPSIIEKRLRIFFEKHSVRRPAFYAKLLTDHPMPIRKKKIMAAIIVPESRGNEKARNRHSGASGPWQVMPFWKKQLKIKGSLFDPTVNLNVASQVYDIHAKEMKHNERKTLTAYSGGAAGYATKVIKLAEEI